MNARELAPCGTSAAYQRHKRRKEDCPPCRAAHAATERRRQGRTKNNPWARGLANRFWAKVALPDGNGCMLWLGALNANGYGLFSIEGRSTSAQHVSQLLAEGPPPDEMRTDAAHACRNRNCVAPDHLRWASRRENMSDTRRDGTAIIGVRNASAKLTDDKAREIRRVFAAGGISKTELGRRYGVHRTTISGIVRGELWSHVGDSE